MFFYIIPSDILALEVPILAYSFYFRFDVTCTAISLFDSDLSTYF